MDNSNSRSRPIKYIILSFISLFLFFSITINVNAATNQLSNTESWIAGVLFDLTNKEVDFNDYEIKNAKMGEGISWTESQNLNGYSATNGTDSNFTKHYSNGYLLTTNDCYLTVCRTTDIGCDVVCIDSDCSDEIEKAINDTSDNGGGKVCLRTGTYPLDVHSKGGIAWDTAIFFDNKNYVTLSGDGWYSTILKLNSNQNGTTIYYDNSGYIKIEDLMIDESLTYNNGIDGQACIKGHGSHSDIVKNIRLYKCGGVGFYPTSCGWSYYENIYVVNSKGNGIELDTPDNIDAVGLKSLNAGGYGISVVGGAVLENAIVSLYGGMIYNATLAGLRIVHANGTTITGMKITESGKANMNDGIFIQDSCGTTLSGMEVYHNYRNGIYIYESNYTSISNSWVKDNRKSGNQGKGISLYKSYYNTITGTHSYDTRSTPYQKYGIFEELSDYNTFTGNVLTPNNLGALYVVGSNTKYCNNIGNATCNLAGDLLIGVGALTATANLDIGAHSFTADGFIVGDGSAQKNITLTSPDASEWCCGVSDAGVFSCSAGAC